jgi:hypothetical protein
MPRPAVRPNGVLIATFASKLPTLATSRKTNSTAPTDRSWRFRNNSRKRVGDAVIAQNTNG